MGNATADAAGCGGGQLTEERFGFPPQPSVVLLPQEAELASDVRVQSEPVVVGGRLLAWWGIALGWVAVNAGYWAWWLAQSGSGTAWLFWPQTAALLYQVAVLPTFFFYYVRQARRPVE